MYLTRPVLAVLVVLVVVVAACGDDAPPTAVDTAPPPGSEGEVVPGEVELLAEGSDGDPEGAGPGLIVDAVDLRAFAGRFLGGQDGASETVDELVTELDGGDGDGRLFVGGVVSSGCFAPDGVELRRDGRDLRLVPTGLEEDPDVVCARAITTVAVVAVARTEVPEDVTVDGEPASAPVGPGTVHAVERLGGDVEPSILEVDSDRDLERLLAGLDVALSVEDLGLPPVPERSQRLAFVVEGCEAATAELVVTAGGEVTAVLRQADEVNGRVECEALEPYLVVADLPAGLVS